MRQVIPDRAESPATLVAIIVAARRAGDRELEREARRRLEERFGVKLSFVRGAGGREDSPEVPRD
jgi:hypothetical protein